MKVKELIEKLLKEDQEKKVLVKGSGRGSFTEAKQVRPGKNKATEGRICILGRY